MKQGLCFYTAMFVHRSCSTTCLRGQGHSSFLMYMFLRWPFNFAKLFYWAYSDSPFQFASFLKFKETNNLIIINCLPHLSLLWQSPSVPWAPSFACLVVLVFGLRRNNLITSLQTNQPEIEFKFPLTAVWLQNNSYHVNYKLICGILWHISKPSSQTNWEISS